MKRNLLSIVQDLLYDLDGDEVSSISDTIESLQVARKIRTVYEELAVRINLPEHYTFYELVASGDPLKPTVMTLPSTAETLESLRYNVADITDMTPNFRELEFLELDEFLDRMYGKSLDDPGVGTFTMSTPNATVDIVYKSDQFPRYYTSFDDLTILLDSYDMAYDTTLVGNKTMAYGKTTRVFSLDDSFVPDLDANQFPLLYQEARKACFADMKQAENPDAARRARGLLLKSQSDKRGVKDNNEAFRRAPNYAR